MRERQLSLHHWLGIALLVTLVPITFWAVTVFSERHVKSGLVTTAPEGSLLPVQQWTLPNGPRVYYLENTELPIVDIWLAYDAGSARDPLPGVADLVHDLYKRETEHLSADAFVDRLESQGTQLDSILSEDMSVFKFRTLSDEDALEDVFFILKEMIRHPKIQEEGFSQLVQKKRVRLQTLEMRPNYRATEAFANKVYGDHPYGHLVQGSLTALDAIALNTVKNFREQYYVPKNAIIVVVGDIPAGVLDHYLTECFDAVEAGKLPEPIQNVDQWEPSTTHIPFSSEQTHIRVGFPLQKMNDPADLTLAVATEILGGGMSSRLFRTLRIEGGLAYHVQASIEPRQSKGPFLVALETRADQSDKALKQLLEELNRYVIEGPTKQEVAKAKSLLAGTFPLKFSGNQWKARLLLSLAFYNRPLDYYDTYLSRLEEITEEDVNQLLTTRFSPNEWAIVTVGPATQ